jgi:hypothetical protein
MKQFDLFRMQKLEFQISNDFGWVVDQHKTPFLSVSSLAVLRNKGYR